MNLDSGFPIQIARERTVIEPFVDAIQGAEFLGIRPRRLLEMARAGKIPGHPIGHGKRKTWRFRLSELAEAMAQEKPMLTLHKGSIIDSSSPRRTESEELGDSRASGKS
jgi:hypothetical protein